MNISRGMRQHPHLDPSPPAQDSLGSLKNNIFGEIMCLTGMQLHHGWVLVSITHVLRDIFEHQLLSMCFHVSANETKLVRSNNCKWS